MIRAHMATYPKRRELVARSVLSIAPQVDQVFLVLSEYTEVPAELSGVPNLVPIIPETDLKDCGKFLPTAAADDVVVLADDDLLYSPSHVGHLLHEGEKVGLDHNVVGLHGTIYRSETSRKALRFERALDRTSRVHQLGTGTMLTLGRNLAPFDVMVGSQKFVDVRYARWLAARGIGCWAAARPDNFLREVPRIQGGHETIYKSFTRHAPAPFVAEVRALMKELSVKVLPTAVDRDGAEEPTDA